MKVHAMALIGSVFLGLTPFQIPIAMAQTAMLETSANMSGRPMEAAKLIGKDVVDRDGNRLGEIQSVIVGPSGKVSKVVLDIGSWLETAKRIAVPWTDLRAHADGQITSTLTKEGTAQAKKYSYLDPSLSGGMITEDGKAYEAGASVSEAGPGPVSER